jgi:hypothetical protein
VPARPGEDKTLAVTSATPTPPGHRRCASRPEACQRQTGAVSLGHPFGRLCSSRQALGLTSAELVRHRLRGRDDGLMSPQLRRYRWWRGRELDGRSEPQPGRTMLGSVRTFSRAPLHILSSNFPRTSRHFHTALENPTVRTLHRRNAANKPLLHSSGHSTLSQSQPPVSSHRRHGRDYPSVMKSLT